MAALTPTQGMQWWSSSCPGMEHKVPLWLPAILCWIWSCHPCRVPHAMGAALALAWDTGNTAEALKRVVMEQRHKNWNWQWQGVKRSEGNQGYISSRSLSTAMSARAIKGPGFCGRLCPQLPEAGQLEKLCGPHIWHPWLKAHTNDFRKGTHILCYRTRQKIPGVLVNLTWGKNCFLPSKPSAWFEP